MYKPESVIENKPYKILWNFEIQTDHLILARRLNQVLINEKKRNCQLVNFSVPLDHNMKIKGSKKIDKYLDLTRKLKKLWNMEVTVIWIVVCALGMFPKSLENILGGGGTGDQRKNRDHPDHGAVRILKNPGDLSRLTQA